MKIKEVMEVDLTPKDVKEIIRQHFILKGIDLDNISFGINNVYGEYGEHPSKELTEVSCIGTRISEASDGTR